MAKKVARLFNTEDLGRIEVLGTYEVTPVSFVKLFREGFEHKKVYGLYFVADYAEGVERAKSMIERHSRKHIKRFIEPIDDNPDSDGWVAVDGEWFLYLAEIVT